MAKNGIKCYESLPLILYESRIYLVEVSSIAIVTFIKK